MSDTNDTGNEHEETSQPDVAEEAPAEDPPTSTADEETVVTSEESEDEPAVPDESAREDAEASEATGGDEVAQQESDAPGSAEASEDPGPDGEVAEPANDDGLDSLFLAPEDSEGELVVDDDGEAGDGAAFAEFNEQIEGLEEERDDYKNRMMRVAADLENFRKRTAREKEEMRKYGIDRVVLELLPVLDNLERALEHAENAAENSSIADGVRMVYRQFVAALKKHGVEGFDSLGETFDPQKHEAIQQTETEDEDTGTILEQYQKGYFLHDRLIRPALVNVAKKVETADTEGVEADGVELEELSDESAAELADETDGDVASDEATEELVEDTDPAGPAEGGDAEQAPSDEGAVDIPIDTGDGVGDEPSETGS